MSIIDKLLESKNKVVEKILDEPDSEYYAIAEQEINDGAVDQGLWAKALVKAKGNETLRKAEYIKLRARQLQAQQRQIAELLPLIAQNIQKIYDEYEAGAQQAKPKPESPAPRGTPKLGVARDHNDNPVKDDLERARDALAEYKSKRN